MDPLDVISEATNSEHITHTYSTQNDTPTTRKVDDRARRVNTLTSNISPELRLNTPPSLMGRVTEGAIERRSSALPPNVMSSDSFPMSDETFNDPIVPTLENRQLESLLKDIETQMEENPNLKDVSLNFPHFAWEAVKAGLAKEGHSNDTLNSYIAESRELQDNMDLILQLQARPELKEKEKHYGKEMSAETFDLIQKLKTNGIDLWQNESKNLNKENLESLGTLCSSHLDKQRTDLQIIFTTKIQVEINTIGTIMDILKAIINNNNSLIRKTLEVPR